MSRTIGIVPGSFKPYHAGHDALLRMAAAENDVVYLLASISSRGSTSGDVMSQIWDEYILPTLPGNVIPEVGGGSPVSKVYQLLQDAEEEGSDDIFRIYSDSGDIKKYTPKALSKSAPTLYAAGRKTNAKGEEEDDEDVSKRIELRGVPRTDTVNVSGTKMREYLETGEMDKFIENLPPSIQGQGEEIFEKLGGKKPTDIKSEAVLRKYIRSTLAIF